MKTLIVTGASRGLGRHVAQRAQAEGYRVIGLARSKPDSAQYETRVCDVTDPAQIKTALGDLAKDENLYGLVNAAGVASMNLTIAMPPETARRIVEVNLLGTIHCAALVGKWLARRKRGRIVNFSTIAVPLAIKGEAVYAASKAGVEGFTRAFAREMADFGVTVNALAPGPVDTALIEKVPAARIREIVERQIIQRQAEPEDVWRTLSTLLDDKADMITGEVIHIGGA